MLYTNSFFIYVHIALVVTEQPIILMSDLPCLQDFRLRDINEYAEWYGHAHRAPELQVFLILSPTDLFNNFHLLYDYLYYSVQKFQFQHLITNLDSY
jgi:hypothetical protein